MCVYIYIYMYRHHKHRNPPTCCKLDELVVDAPVVHPAEEVGDDDDVVVPR